MLADKPKQKGLLVLSVCTLIDSLIMGEFSSLTCSTLDDGHQDAGFTFSCSPPLFGCCLAGLQMVGRAGCQ